MSDIHSSMDESGAKEVNTSPPRTPENHKNKRYKEILSNALIILFIIGGVAVIYFIFTSSSSSEPKLLDSSLTPQSIIVSATNYTNQTIYCISRNDQKQSICFEEQAFFGFKNGFCGGQQ